MLDFVKQNPSKLSWTCFLLQVSTDVLFVISLIKVAVNNHKGFVAINKYIFLKLQETLFLYLTGMNLLQGLYNQDGSEDFLW